MRGSMCVWLAAMTAVWMGCAEEGGTVGGGGDLFGGGGMDGTGGMLGAGGTNTGTGGATGTGGMAGTGGATGSGGIAGTGGASGTGGIPSSGGPGPLQRAAGFQSVAHPLGQPLPDMPAGTWHEETIAGSVCRDGSPMKIFYRYSDTSRNYVIFLEGGGVCYDDFFCPLNPKNVNESVDGESILAAALVNFGGAAQIPQTPKEQGIFLDDPRNPVADWNHIYVPYCSGDVYGGTRSGVLPPKWPANTTPQEFQGYGNAGKVLGRVVATFKDAEKALLTGSSAGGVGSLMHGGAFADMLVDHTSTRGFVVSDSGPVFDDEFLPICIQKEWRQLWGLDDAFPKDCSGCFNADGGGIAAGLGQYLFEKYPAQDQVIGGLISSTEDEIMKMFFSKGNNDCMGAPHVGDEYSRGVRDFVNEVVDPDRFAAYIMPGTLHMHLTNPRFYADNGTNMSVAEWLGRLLDNEAIKVGM